MMRVYLFLVIIGVLLCTCENDECTNPSDVSNNTELVPVSVQFVFGIKDAITYLKFNEKTYYKAILSGLIPFSGPEGELFTYLPKGKNEIHVAFRGNTNILRDFKEYFIIEDQDFYHMTLHIKSVGDSIYLEISNDILR